MSSDHDGGTLRECLHSVMASEDPRLVRLGQAGTSVSFQIQGAPGESVTVLLDRNPPSVEGGDEPAEITIELSREQAAHLARGTLSLPPAMLDGEIPYRGPVRKYLVVDPVLRAMLADVAGNPH
jgi:hypothetical protein